MEKVNNIGKLESWAWEFFEGPSPEIRHKREKRIASLYIMKGPRFILDDKFVTPIYGGSWPRYMIGADNDLQGSVPKELELLGFFSLDSGYLAVNSYDSSCFFSDEAVDSVGSVMKDVRKNIFQTFVYKAKKSFDECDNDQEDNIIVQQNKAEAQARYANAYPVKSADEIIQKCYEVSDISRNMDRYFLVRNSTEDDVEKALRIFLNGVDIEALIDQFTSWTNCEKFLFNEKMIQSELQTLYSSEITDDIAVKLLFKKLKADKVKTVQVTFDFGYEQVTKAVDVELAASNSYRFLKTQSDSNHFSKKYKQRITMEHDNFNEWIRYVKTVKFRGKPLFECGKVETPYALENCLFSIIANLDYDNKERSVDEVKKCLNDHPDHSITEYFGKSLMYCLLNNFYSTIGLAQCLYEGGFRLQDNEIDMLRQDEEINRLKSGSNAIFSKRAFKSNDYEKIIRLLGVLDA